ncbi:mitochondrial transcription termination factor (mTERF) family protein [Nitzschia inconspicua]|uniref:Mitochondrial transcription termination factor (mTERF) family protein n=1 Tax=Nitzschia inconspicua TaxID=303405 RepID=A0A9K3KTT1_9STRA|nr:mitochondrial transcription termination factor (mTERF) family protein [Nitzschia inconspicua]
MKVPSSSRILAVSLTLSLISQESSALSSRAISPGDFNANDASSSARTTSSSSLSSSSMRAVQAIAADANNNNNNNPNNSMNPRRIKRKAPGAPLVDSSLLRYISKQKQTQLFPDDLSNDFASMSENDDSGKPNPYVQGLTSARVAPFNDTMTTTLSSSRTNAIKQQIVARSSSIATLDMGQPTATTPRTIMLSAPSPLLAEDVYGWRLRQFNHHAIAQRLIALGAEEEEAKLAGQTVQRYCLVRTARRRIRIFLKERDNLWKRGATLSNGMLDESAAATTNRDTDTVTALSMQSSVTTKALSVYGLEDTLQVMQEHGLSGKDICSILTHTPSLALMMPRKSFLEQDADSTFHSDSTRTGETLEDTLERSFHGLLLTTLGLRKYDARKVLRTCAGLLSVRGSKSAEQVMAMMTKLGVSEASVARDKASLPTLLSRSPAGLFRLVSFLCSSSVRMPLDQVGPLLRRKESRELMDAVIPLPPASSNGASAGDFDSDIGMPSDDDPIAEAAFWSKTREERKRNIEELYRNMTKTAFALRDEIGAEDLSRVISAYPNVLLLDVERQILPVAQYLMDDLGIMKGDLARVLQLYPMLLGMEIADMEVVVGYLLALGVDEDDLSSIFRAFPALLTMKPQDMHPVVDYLRSIGVTDVGSFITRLPPVLGYSVEKELKPKWEFLKVVCMFASFEINKFPAYFSYPLERVIRTRYEYLTYKGISRQLIPVDAVLRYGDKDFALRVARDDDKGEMFRAFCKNRSKKLRGDNSPRQSNGGKTKRRSSQSQHP